MIENFLSKIKTTVCLIHKHTKKQTNETQNKYTQTHTHT